MGSSDFPMKRIYMDHASTTPMAPEVIEAMAAAFVEIFGNASSLHQPGLSARAALEEARERVAGLIGAEAGEVYFTSGGTESDNLAIRGAALANRDRGRHIITTTIEHPAVLEPCKALEKEGFEVTYLPVTREGLVEVEALEAAIRKDTILISIMHANNEIGTIQPIAEAGEIARSRGIVFHTDAVQTVGKIPAKVDDLRVDLLSISSHKLHGPKGVGALYIRKKTPIEPIIFGGGHERGMRSGTENVPGIIGLAAASELAERNLEGEMVRISGMRDRLADYVLERVEDTWVNGSRTKRLPNNLNLGFSFIEGEALLLRLDAKGIAVSTGSACSSKKTVASHVLTAIGLRPQEAHGSLRITLGRENTDEEVDRVGEAIVEVAESLRAMSPFRRS
ncbi:MAG: putative cysteine desulfurase 2 [Methanosaeta sp. PtaU1.Bin055]|nr:MAG: putative cysteine desulfurase 2 [Methanosaeta sp. PtaU1.Bin055]